MLCLTYKATSIFESVDESGVGIVLLANLETQVNFEDVVEVQHLISIQGQTSNSHYVMQCRAHHAERQVEGIY